MTRRPDSMTVAPKMKPGISPDLILDCNDARVGGSLWAPRRTIAPRVEPSAVRVQARSSSSPRSRPGASVDRPPVSKLGTSRYASP